MYRILSDFRLAKMAGASPRTCTFLTGQITLVGVGGQSPSLHPHDGTLDRKSIIVYTSNVCDPVADRADAEAKIPRLSAAACALSECKRRTASSLGACIDPSALATMLGRHLHLLRSKSYRKTSHILVDSGRSCCCAPSCIAANIQRLADGGVLALGILVRQLSVSEEISSSLPTADTAGAWYSDHLRGRKSCRRLWKLKSGANAIPTPHGPALARRISARNRWVVERHIRLARLPASACSKGSPRHFEQACPRTSGNTPGPAPSSWTSIRLHAEKAML